MPLHRNTNIVVANILYATQNVMMERKLGEGTNPLVNIIILGSTIVTLAFITNQVTKSGEATAINWSYVGWTIFIGAGLFFADFNLFASYAKGISATTVCTVTIIMPVFAAAFKFILNHKDLPTGHQLAAWALGTAAVLVLLSDPKSAAAPPIP